MWFYEVWGIAPGRDKTEKIVAFPDDQESDGYSVAVWDLHWHEEQGYKGLEVRHVFVRQK